MGIVGNVNFLRTQVEVVADLFQTGRMTRLVGLLIGLVFLVTACGSAEGTPAPNSVQGASGSVSTSDTTASGESTPTPSVDSAAVQNPSGVEGPAAPDFSLVLADGSTFTLSEGSKPVYMVFWAEW